MTTMQRPTPAAGSGADAHPPRRLDHQPSPGSRARLAVLVAGCALLLVGGAAAIAARATDATANTAAPNTAAAKPAVAQKNAGAYGLVQLSVLNETAESVPVTLCYEPLNVASSCSTYTVTKDTPQTVLHEEVQGIVGSIPTGVAFVARNPSMGDPHFMLSSAEHASAESFKAGGDVPEDLPFIGSSVIWMDAGEVQRQTVNGYTLRLERQGDVSGNDKTMRVIIEKTPTTG